MVVAMVGCEEEGRRCQREELCGENTKGRDEHHQSGEDCDVEVAKITQRRFLCGGVATLPPPALTFFLRDALADAESFLDS